MNSLVSVEDEELSCDDSLVLNASNISGSSVGSESENKSNNSNETSSELIDTEDQSPHVDNLLVCLPDRRTLVERSGEPVDISVNPNVLSLQQHFDCSEETGADFRGFAVDLECLGLPILLENNIISLDNNIDFTYDIENLFLSDTESTESFDGFTETSATSFEGFVQRNFDTSLKNDNGKIPFSQDIGPSDKFTPVSEKLEHTAKPAPRGRGRPRKYPLNPEQNSSKGTNNPFHLSSAKKSKKEANGLDGVTEQRQSEKKTLKDKSNTISEVNVRTRRSETASRQDVECVKTEAKNVRSRSACFLILNNRRSSLRPISDVSSTDGGDPYWSSSEESFEGFYDNEDLENNILKPEQEHHLSSDEKSKPKLVSESSLSTKPASYKRNTCLKVQENDGIENSQEELSDFIGINCDAIGCTINWLESGEIRTRPVTINNGIVFELNEFAKKINWESRYIAIWILRLRGYEEVVISDEDLKQIHLIIRRRKALTINFAGSLLLKAKLLAFDNTEFLLPTAEKLDNAIYSTSKNHIFNRDALYDSKEAAWGQNFGTEANKRSFSVDMKRNKHIDKKKNSQRSSENVIVISNNESLDVVEKDSEIGQSFEESSKQKVISNRIRLHADSRLKEPLDFQTPLRSLISETDSIGLLNNAVLSESKRVRQNAHSIKEDIENSIRPINRHRKRNLDVPHFQEKRKLDNSKEIELPKVLCNDLKNSLMSKKSKFSNSSTANNNILSPSLRSRSKGTGANNQEIPVSFEKDRGISEEDLNVKVKNIDPLKSLREQNGNIHLDISSHTHTNNLKLKMPDELTQSFDYITNKQNKIIVNDSYENYSTKTPTSSEYDNDDFKSRNLYVGSASSLNTVVESIKSNTENAYIHPENNSCINRSAVIDKYGVSSKGRVLKPTVKIQDMYSDKTNKLYTSFELETSSLNQTILNSKSPNRATTPNSSSAKNDLFVTMGYRCGVKLIQNLFIDDKSIIGKHCQNSLITITLLNSEERALKPLTNGVVYELYHFFKQRNAKLTALVHTIYRLNGLPIEKAPIISTMAKIHELVKVIWDEQVKADPNMPFKVFEMGINSSYKATTITEPDKNSKSDTEYSRSYSKRKKEILLTKSASEQSEIICSEIENAVADSSSENKNDNRIFDLNATKGKEGNITRGDIVFVYTRWLKKKMEGQCKVFVTDLSKDVENLIMNRNVGTIRIPVGTLMSSSVKLFEEFRKLSKINMQAAKTYLLGDWIQDIQDLLNPKQLKKNVNEEDAISLANVSQVRSEKHETNLFDFETDVGFDAAGNELKADVMQVTSTYSPVEKITKFTNAYNSKSNNKVLTAELNGAKTMNSIVNNVGCSEKTSRNKKELGSNKIEVTNQGKSTDGNAKVAEEYEVEKIVGYRIVKIGDKSITEFRVRWVGFTSEEDSWVNVADLQCPDRLTEFWDALNKQRALKGLSEGIHTEINQANMDGPVPFQLPKDLRYKATSIQNGQENLPPNLRSETTGMPHKFFNLLISNLKPNLIDYQYDEEGPIPKRVRVSKGEILSIFDNWCQENHEKLLTGANKPVEVNVLISRVKDFMDSKKVRNFNPDCIFEACFRMSLMKAKLQDPCKVNEYLSGDTIDFIESSLKHQEFVKVEIINRLRKHKNEKIQVRSESQKVIETKMKAINRLEKESLLIAKYIEDHGMKVNFERMIESDISCLKKVLSLSANHHEESCSHKTMEILKSKSKNTLQELKEIGLQESTVDELVKIGLALKS